MPSPSPSVEPLTLPGPMQELPEGVGEGASWTEAAGRLPAGLDSDARYADELTAFSAVTQALGDRPNPPNSPRVTRARLDAPPREIRVRVAYPTYADERVWGEQFLVILREGRDGWRLDGAWARALCTTVIDHEKCA